MTDHLVDARVPRDLHAFIAGLPKAELHVHHVGSASPRIVAELAARHPDSKVPTDPEALADYFTFTDFAHFIDVYLSVVDLIRTPEDVRLLTYEVARDLARQQVRYAELTITPFSSTRRGIDERAFMAAIEDARKAAEAEFGTVLRWCFDIPGEAGLESAEETARLATDDRLRPEGLVSFGLGGPEIGVPQVLLGGHLAGDLVGEVADVLGGADQRDHGEVDLDEVGEVAELVEALELLEVAGHAAGVPGGQLADDPGRRGADVVDVELGLGQAGDERGTGVLGAHPADDVSARAGSTNRRRRAAARAAATATARASR